MSLDELDLNGYKGHETVDSKSPPSPAPRANPVKHLPINYSHVATSESFHDGISDKRPKITPRVNHKLKASNDGHDIEPSWICQDRDERTKSKVSPRPCQRQGSINTNSQPSARMLLLSNKVKTVTILQSAVLSNVIFIQYKYDISTLDSISALVSQHLGNRKVSSIAFVFHCSANSINISAKDDRVLSLETWDSSDCIQGFFRNLINTHMEKNATSRVDIFGCSLAAQSDCKHLCTEMAAAINIPVGLWRDYSGCDLLEDSGDGSTKVSVSELYFRTDCIRIQSGQSLAGFEKIRTVGKGAYGTAVLYRKKDDDSLVILKGINLHDLNASERQLALNEVKVLSILDHPNIISYYDSFEEDGIVMIEMEYADGGTLAQYLTSQVTALEEKTILSMFAQMVAALKYIHEHQILHRDLKTANIFLTKEGIIKVGDFGISKLMSTNTQAANTVLGTPYYISPEMCEGKPYKDKSDIWALGCVLYEMACLQRTFEGSNLPALVNKIMKGQFAPVKGAYSQEFKQLIKDMLEKQPDNRPSAAKIWHERLPEMIERFDDPVTDYEDDLLIKAKRNSLPPGRRRRTRSVLYVLELASMNLTPVPLPSKIKIREVAIGSNHVIAVSMERTVYTWGEGSKGQLGHGNYESRGSPCDVEALKGKSIVRASCGEDFSLFASDNGIVMTCGDGSYGCLGHDDWSSTPKPRLIEALLSVDVVSVACGTHHVCVVSRDGQVFTWGCGEDGRLGLGNDDNYCKPMEAVLPEQLRVRSCHCGEDGTMLITDIGSVLACGNNEGNKLGLNERQGFLMAMKNIFTKTEVVGEKTFCVVRSLVRHRVVDVSMGPLHTAVVIEPGYVYTMGRNTEGQLGAGNTKPQSTPYHVSMFDEKTRVKCGPYYTVACTIQNELFIWGARLKSFLSENDSGLSSLSSNVPVTKQEGTTERQHSRQPSTTSISSVSSVPADSSKEGGYMSNGKAVDKPVRESLSPNKNPIMKSPSQVSLNTSAGSRPSSSVPQRQLSYSGSLREGALSKEEYDISTSPVALMRLDSNGAQSMSGDTVALNKFYCNGENLFLQVETTAPPPKQRPRRKRNFRRRADDDSQQFADSNLMRYSASSREGGDEYSSEASEHDTKAVLSRESSMHNDTSVTSHIPTWLKAELNSDEVIRSVQVVDVDELDDDKSGPARDVNITTTHKGNGIVQPCSHRDNHSAAKKELHTRLGIESSNTNKMRKKKVAGEIDPSDGLSSSSSSLETPVSIGSDEKTCFSKKSSKRNMMGGPLKSKTLPQHGHKVPLRNRPHGQTRRTDVKVVKAEGDTQRLKAMELQAELERTKEEKLKTEKRLQELEEQLSSQQKILNQSALRQASQRETELKDEITHLRSELKAQSSQLSDNHELVMDLKDQLVAIQMEQQRLNVAESRPVSRHSQQRESRICSVQ